MHWLWLEMSDKVAECTDGAAVRLCPTGRAALTLVAQIRTRTERERERESTGVIEEWQRSKSCHNRASRVN